MSHLPLLALITLAACAPISAQEPPSSDPAPQAPAGNCNAEAARAFVGRTPDEATQRAAQTASGGAIVRVIPHDGMATMDFREDRLNLRLDEAGRIGSVDCG
jgi:hypothetical protein